MNFRSLGNFGSLLFQPFFFFDLPQIIQSDLRDLIGTAFAYSCIDKYLARGRGKCG
jgi:hypothetical protein